MAKRILNNPSPNILMNSMRSIGYSFKTAFADIIDNSISANASEIRIYTPINSEELFITFFDNGEGMSRDELLNAMKYGSDRIEYGTLDLGRFGLGLKSASLSQCRKLTVVSKKDNCLSAFSWDLDCVLKNKTWDCLELEKTEIDDLPQVNIIKNSKQGTLVIWEDFDILYRKSNGKVFEAISEEVEDAEKHLSLVFHRFINNSFNPLKIYINDDKVKSCDPFLEDNPKTDSQKPSIINYLESDIKIQPFILPHMNDLTNEDIDKMGGDDLLRNGEWDIDIKKQNANIPKALLASLKKVVSNVRSKSRAKSEKRAKLTLEKDNNKIWNKGLNRENKEIFFINNDSEFIKNFIDDFGDGEKSKILHLLDIVSSSLPYDDIFNSMCNRAVGKSVEQEGLDSIVIEGINQFKRLKNLLRKSDEDVFNVLKTYEPFDDETILNLVKRRIDDER